VNAQNSDVRDYVTTSNECSESFGQTIPYEFYP